MQKSPGKRVLIFGPTGNVGTYTVKYALELYNNIYVFIRNPDKLPVAVKESVYVIVKDIINIIIIIKTIIIISLKVIIIYSIY